MMPVAFGACLSVLFATGFAAGAYSVAVKTTGAARSAVRFAGFVVALLAIPLAVFELLYFTRSFRWELVGLSATGCAVVAAVAVRRDPAVRAALAADMGALAELVAAFRAAGWRGVLVLFASMLLAVHVSRGVASPPISWDALTYHLPRAAMWVQSHGPYTYDAPGAWSYYTHFPIMGDALSALAMVTPRSDVLVGATWVSVWALFACTTLALATTLGATSANALLGAVATSLVPCVLVHMATAYVDTAAALLVVAAAVLLVDFERRQVAGVGGLALGSLALAVAIRTTALPLAAGGFVAWALTARTPGREVGRSLLVGLAMAAVLLVPHFAIRLVRFGSPIWPFGLSVLGKTVFPWQDEVSWFFFSRPKFPVLTYLDRAFWLGIGDSPLLQNNLGVPGLVLLVTVLVVAAWERKRYPRTALVFLATGLLGFASLVLSARDWFVDDLRYMAALPAVSAAFVAASGKRLASVGLALVIVTGMLFGLPLRFGNGDWDVLLHFLALLVPSAVLGALSVAFLVKRVGAGSALAPLGAVPALLVLSGSLESIRAPFVSVVRRDAAIGAACSSGPLIYSASAPGMLMADLIDDPDHPHRIAITAGWDDRGHNWFIYPFLGRRLENTLEFVSPLADGSLTSPRLLPPEPSRADYAAFRKELLRRHVDVVVTLGPPPFESLFFDRHPEDFPPLGRGPTPGNTLHGVAAR